jgi:hypothetical protein
MDGSYSNDTGKMIHGQFLIAAVILGVSGKIPPFLAGLLQLLWLSTSWSLCHRFEP